VYCPCSGSQEGTGKWGFAVDVIPAVDVLDGVVVRLAQGDYGRVTSYGDDPVEAAADFVEEGARLVHVVDLGAARSGRTDGDLWRRLGSAGLPFEAAGGLRSVEAAEAAVASGARRVVLGTAAVWDPATCATVVGAVGAERVVAALDVRDGRARGAGWEDDGRSLDEAIRDVVDAGVRRLLVTAIVRDGMLTGPDVELLTRVESRSGLPVIASGGVGSLGDIRALAEAGIGEAIVGRALYEGRFTLVQALGAARSR